MANNIYAKIDLKDFADAMASEIPLGTRVDCVSWTTTSAIEAPILGATVAPTLGSMNGTLALGPSPNIDPFRGTVAGPFPGTMPKLATSSYTNASTSTGRYKPMEFSDIVKLKRETEAYKFDVDAKNQFLDMHMQQMNALQNEIMSYPTSSKRSAWPPVKQVFPIKSSLFGPPKISFTSTTDTSTSFVTVEARSYSDITSGQCYAASCSYDALTIAGTELERKLVEDIKEKLVQQIYEKSGYFAAPTYISSDYGKKSARLEWSGTEWKEWKKEEPDDQYDQYYYPDPTAIIKSAKESKKKPTSPQLELF